MDIITEMLFEDKGFLEVEKTIQEIRSAYASESETNYLIYRMAKAFVGVKRVSQSKSAKYYESLEEKARALADQKVQARFTELNRSGQMPSGKMVAKLKTLIKILSDKAGIDYVDAMRMVFPGYAAQRKKVGTE